jgi:hypothetical protein
MKKSCRKNSCDTIPLNALTGNEINNIEGKTGYCSNG